MERQRAKIFETSLREDSYSKYIKKLGGMGASLEQALHTKDTSRHIKKHLISLVVKEMHVKTTMKASRVPPE